MLFVGLLSAANATQGSKLRAMHSVNTMLKSFFFIVCSSSLTQNSFGPVPYAHIQRAGFVQMKVRTAAIPALPQSVGSIGSRFKGRANLFWPHIPLGIRGRQGHILTPAFFHWLTLLCTKIQANFSTISVQRISQEKEK